MIRLALPDTDALNLNQALNSHPVKVNAVDISEDIDNPTGDSVPSLLHINKPVLGLRLLSQSFNLCQKPRLIIFDCNNIVVTAFNNYLCRFFDSAMRPE